MSWERSTQAVSLNAHAAAFLAVSDSVWVHCLRSLSTTAQHSLLVVHAREKPEASLQACLPLSSLLPVHATRQHSEVAVSPCVCKSPLEQDQLIRWESCVSLLLCCHVPLFQQSENIEGACRRLCGWQRPIQEAAAPTFLSALPNISSAHQQPILVLVWSLSWPSRLSG